MLTQLQETDLRRRVERGSRCSDQSGYTLVALLAMMSLLALFALAAVPRIQQQAQREREKEAIFRGEQVADAIRLYYIYRGAQGPNSLPTSMDQLLEGIPRGTKKLQILRAEAAIDVRELVGVQDSVHDMDAIAAQVYQQCTVGFAVARGDEGGLAVDLLEPDAVGRHLRQVTQQTAHDVFA